MSTLSDAGSNFDYRPLVGPSVWIKIPNRDPKKLGAIQRFDRENLEKLKTRVSFADRKLAEAEAEEKKRAEANRLKPGTRVYYDVFAAPARRQYATVLHPEQASQLLGATYRMPSAGFVYALLDGSLTVAQLYTKHNLFLAD